MRVPVEVRGTAVDGTPLEESTHTGVIGVMGAMIWTSRMLRVGTEIELTNRFSQRTARFRVAWVSDEQSNGRPPGGRFHMRRQPVKLHGRESQLSHVLQGESLRLRIGRPLDLLHAATALDGLNWCASVIKA